MPIRYDDNDTYLCARQSQGFASTFGSGLLYEKADFSNVRSFNPEQYDNFGDRTYSANGDFDGNGIINQDERFSSYVLQLETSTQFQGNYQTPRTVYAGVMFRF